jgi:hypothetical protein
MQAHIDHNLRKAIKAVKGHARPRALQIDTALTKRVDLTNSTINIQEEQPNSQDERSQENGEELDMQTAQTIWDATGNHHQVDRDLDNNGFFGLDEDYEFGNRDDNAASEEELVSQLNKCHNS